MSPTTSSASFTSITRPPAPSPRTRPARVEALSAENDALIDQLEQELPDGSTEAEAANARIEAIERELETIEDARHEIDPALKSADRDVRLYRG